MRLLDHIDRVGRKVEMSSRRMEAALTWGTNTLLGEQDIENKIYH